MRDRPEEEAAGSTVATLRGMLLTARDRSRGQGVVQGSTVFFKNLAESVGQSNRNLKIGLAFLTLSFVVVAGSLGYMVLRAFQAQETTKATLERQLRGTGEDMSKQNRSLLESLSSLEARQQQLEESLRVAEAARTSAELEARATREELRQLREQMQSVQRATRELGIWVEAFNKTYAHDRDLIVERIGGLSAPPKK